MNRQELNVISSLNSQAIEETSSMTPKVSVALITYNHEKFISQSVESVMMQETDFDYELVVGEDCSTDNTRQILLDLKEKYPDRLKLLLHPQNIGPQENTRQTLEACQGQYLAVLMGDDYWLLPHKLQKQADALDQNPDWSICCSQGIAFYKDGSDDDYLWPPFDPEPISTLDDLVKASFVSPITSLYRRSVVDIYPDWIFQVEICDYALGLFFAQYGKIRFYDQVFSAYRRHSGGIWSQRDRIEQRTALARDLKIIGRYLSWQHHRILESRASRLLLSVARIYLSEGKNSEARCVMREIFPKAYFLLEFPRRRLTLTFLRLYAPWLIPVLQRVKRFFVPIKYEGEK